MAKGLMNMTARGSMRNDTAATKQSQHPENKDPGEVTPGPQYKQTHGANPIKMKLPKGLESDAHRTGKKVMHLAEGHHVKNSDGSTSFHMHSLDGEPISADAVQDPESGEEGGGNDATPMSGMQGSPYGVSEALKGMSM